MEKSLPTKNEFCEAVAESLRDFGYPDATCEMIVEVMDGYIGGLRGEELPHGIIGRFAERQFAQVEESGFDLIRLQASEAE